MHKRKTKRYNIFTYSVLASVFSIAITGILVAWVPVENGCFWTQVNNPWLEIPPKEKTENQEILTEGNEKKVEEDIPGSRRNKIYALKDQRNENLSIKHRKIFTREAYERLKQPKNWDSDKIIEKLSHFISPVEDAHIPQRESHLPGAPREYRSGIHQGIDYYNGYVGVPIQMNTPAVAVDHGTVIRADHDYTELSYEKWTELSNQAQEFDEETPEKILDEFRGKQVWLEHDKGIVTRYAHLNAIPKHIKEGKIVEKGEIIGKIGNSGTRAGAQGTSEGPHLHFEIWLGQERFLGKELGKPKAREVLMEILVEKNGE